MAVTEPVKVTSSAREAVSTGTGQKAAKGNKVTFDYVIVNGRTGDELETSFGAQPVSLVLDKTRRNPSSSKNLIGTPVGSRFVIAVAPKEGLAKGVGQRRTS